MLVSLGGILWLYLFFGIYTYMLVDLAFHLLLHQLWSNLGVGNTALYYIFFSPFEDVIIWIRLVASSMSKYYVCIKPSPRAQPHLAGWRACHPVLQVLHWLRVKAFSTYVTDIIQFRRCA